MPGLRGLEAESVIMLQAQALLLNAAEHGRISPSLIPVKVSYQNGQSRRDN